jgi:hypothetical protein
MRRDDATPLVSVDVRVTAGRAEHGDRVDAGSARRPTSFRNERCLVDPCDRVVGHRSKWKGA